MEEKDDLLIDEEYAPKLTREEAEGLSSLIQEFVEGYRNKAPEDAADQWLETALAPYLPRALAETSAAEISATIQTQQTQKESLKYAVIEGIGKESWFATTVKSAVAFMGTEYVARYLQQLDAAMADANAALYDTLHTAAGTINMNPQLDGFIAEQYHAQTFNLNAEAAGSPYRAQVLTPEGSAFPRNSVDIVIRDEAGNIVKRYQSKYCKDPRATADAFAAGDYRGQQKLVPEDQLQGIGTKATDVLRAPDGTTSTPLSKERAKQLQEEAQSGNWQELNWNEYRLKDLSMGIGKQAAQTALLAAAIGVGFSIAQSLWLDEKIRVSQVVKDGLTAGADAGLMAAVAGAVKVAAETGLLRFIPKGTPAGVIANVVFVAFENAKILSDYAQGYTTLQLCLNRMEMTTVSTVCGIVVSGWTGAQLGSVAGMVFGPVGIATGGVVGGVVGYMAGAKTGEMMIKAVQKLRKKTGGLLPYTVTGAKTVTLHAKTGIENFCGNLRNLTDL